MASIGITASIQRACSSQHIIKKQSTQARPARSSGTKQATNVVTPNVDGLKLAQKQKKSPSRTGQNTEDETQDSKNSGKPSHPSFCDERWKNGTWVLNMFVKQGRMDWDAVIVAAWFTEMVKNSGPAVGMKWKGHFRSKFLVQKIFCVNEWSKSINHVEQEAKRRRFLELHPEASSNEKPVLFRSSIIPWWAWILHSHLPEAELLNGRAAMVGFFMAYIVDALTGLNVVGQTGNVICKGALLFTIIGILVVQRKEDINNIRKLADEATFYDEQWQASWQSSDATNAVEEQSNKKDGLC